MTRTHRDLQDLLGAYALDAVEPDEADELTEHLRSCPQCRAELAEHQSVAALLANTGGPAPAALWDRIAGSLDEDDATPAPAPRRAPAEPGDPAGPGALDVPDGLATVTPLRAPADRGRGRRPAVGAVLGAVAAVVVLVVGLVGLRTIEDQDRRLDDLAAQVQTAGDDRAAAAALADPDSTLVRLTAADGGVALPAVVTEDGRGYLLGGPLPDAGVGATYQLWGLDGTRAVSLGVLGRDPGVVPFHVEGPVDALAVTAEVEGGVDQPTSDPLAAGDLDTTAVTTLPS